MAQANADTRLLSREAQYAAHKEALHAHHTPAPKLRSEFSHLIHLNPGQRLFHQTTYPAGGSDEPLHSRVINWKDELANGVPLRSDSSMQVSDAQATSGSTVATIPEEAPLQGPLAPISASEQRADASVQAIRQLVEATTAASAAESRRIDTARTTFFISEQDGLLKHRSVSIHGHEGLEHHRVVVPRARRGPLLTAYHVSPIYGHRGYQTLYELLGKYYYWPGMYSDVKKWCASCEHCRGEHGLFWGL